MPITPESTQGTLDNPLPDYRFLCSYTIDPKVHTLPHVHNVAYFAFIDQARMAYLKQVGCPGIIEETGFGHVVASNHCDYLAPLHAPDELVVGVKTTAVGNHSITLEFSVWSQQQRLIAARASSTILTFNHYAHTKVKIPESTKTAIEQLEHSADVVITSIHDCSPAL